MRELETILDKRDVALCAPLLLIYAHKKCKTIGRLDTLHKHIHSNYTCNCMVPIRRQN